MPLLQLDTLTVRFGGLTAVRGLNLTVERGQIVSLIGPNGAGKTTVFNAITGIYEPTEGKIRVQQQELIRRLTWRVRLTCIFVGLLTGVAVMLLAADANLLWRATIRHNMLLFPAVPGAQRPIEERPFVWSQAWKDFISYLGGGLAIEPDQRGPWLVKSPHLNRSVAETSNETDAMALKQLLEDAVEWDRRLADISADSRWRLTIDHERLDELRAARNYVRAAAPVGFALGFVVGVAGAYAVWRRSRRTPDVVARGGLARTFQNIRLFREMTVLENVLIGLDAAHASGGRASPDMWPRIRMARGLTREALEMLAFVGLEAKANSLAGSLAYGDGRRLEVARALATRPDLLLLDEPAAGMNPKESRGLTELVRQIRDRGVTVLLIEHHMNVVMEISDRVAVLDYGSKIAEGSPATVKNDPAVIEAYLGSS